MDDIDCNTESQEPEELGKLEISIHAIIGKQNDRTMQLTAIINNWLLLILVDFGSTHNFVSRTAATHLGLSTMPKIGMNVLVANGERIVSQGICQAVTFLLDSHNFTVNFFVIPLDGFDIVLGVK